MAEAATAAAVPVRTRTPAARDGAVGTLKVVAVQPETSASSHAFLALEGACAQLNIALSTIPFGEVCAYSNCPQ